MYLKCLSCCLTKCSPCTLQDNVAAGSVEEGQEQLNPFFLFL